MYVAPIVGIAGVRSRSTMMTALAALIALVAVVASRPRQVTTRGQTRALEPRLGTEAVAQVMCLSACRDSQYAYESSVNGFFTEILMPIVASGNATIRDILLGTGVALVGRGVPQHPSISLSGTSSNSLEDIALINMNKFFV